MSVDPTAAVLACWAGAKSVRYTTQIVNCVSLRSSPVLSLCVGSSDQCDGNHCCAVFDGSVCVCGKVLCHVVVVVVRVCLVWCVRSVVSCFRVCEACELHERSPCAPKFAERTQAQKLRTLQRSTLLLKLGPRRRPLQNYQRKRNSW